MFRKVDVSFWQDSDMIELTPEGKYFYLYLLTNPHTTLCGIYEISKRVMSFETGFNIDTIDKLIRQFEEKGKIIYDPGTCEIFIKNWYRYNFTSSPKVIKGIIHDLKKVKSGKLLTAFWNTIPDDVKSVLIEYGYPIDTLSIPYGYPMDTDPHIDIDKDLDIDKDKEIDIDIEKDKTAPSQDCEDSPSRTPYKQIVELYHRICKSLPRVKVLNETRKRLIRARWKEHPDMSFWEEYFKRVEASDFLCGRSEPSGGRPPFMADFEWLIRPSNFVKVIEGRYDNRQAVDRKIEIEQEIKKLTQKWGRY
jgi:hypothetical protein